MKKSFWQKLESVLTEIFKVSTDVADAAEPIIDIEFPGISGLYNLSVAAAINAENAADAAASTQTTEAAKLAAVIATVTPILIQAAAAGGLPAPTTAQIDAYATSVLNGITALSSTTGTIAA